MNKDAQLIAEAYKKVLKENDHQLSILDAIISHQEQLIKDTYGDEAASTANYGWGVDDGAYSTKVYGVESGVKILTTYYNEDASSIEDLSIIDDEWVSQRG